MILQEPATSNFDLHFKLLRVPVRVHPGFWITSVLLNLGPQIDPLAFALDIAAVFISILVHEFGHALASRYFGERHNSVILYSMGGLCVHGDLDAKRWPQIWILLWGPFAGFILGGILFGVRYALYRASVNVPEVLDGAIIYAIFINLIWGLVNFVPVFPLDGGQIMRAILIWNPSWAGELRTFTLSAIVGGVTAVLALALHLRFGTGLLTPIFFGALAYQNFQLRRQMLAMGEYGYREHNPPREAWEQDADWWKKK